MRPADVRICLSRFQARSNSSAVTAKDLVVLLPGWNYPLAVPSVTCLGSHVGLFASRSEALAAEVAWLTEHWLDRPLLSDAFEVG